MAQNYGTVAFLLCFCVCGVEKYFHMTLALLNQAVWTKLIFYETLALSTNCLMLKREGIQIQGGFCQYFYNWTLPSIPLFSGPCLQLVWAV
jgi:hypothetical protein